LPLAARANAMLDRLGGPDGGGGRAVRLTGDADRRREVATICDAPFYRTQKGHGFHEHTVPELVRQFRRTADLLARLVEIETQRPHREPAQPPRDRA
jgi:hypothetical protein